MGYFNMQSRDEGRARRRWHSEGGKGIRPSNRGKIPETLRKKHRRGEAGECWQYPRPRIRRQVVDGIRGQCPRAESSRICENSDVCQLIAPNSHESGYEEL